MDIYLNELKYDGELIHQWPFIQITQELRLYYLDSGDLTGFKFYAVSWTSHEHGDDFFDLKSVTVECLFHGVAYWDGIRHLYMGDEATDNYGYHYYPHIVEEHIACLNTLRELEKKYCREFE